MLNMKTTSVIALAISMSAIAGQAAAQTNPQTLDTAHATQTVKSAEAEPRDVPKAQSTDKVTRVVKPVPTLASPTQPKQAYVSRGVINAATSEPKTQTRFIYNRSAVKTQMPVYFSEDALKAK